MKGYPSRRGGWRGRLGLMEIITPRCVRYLDVDGEEVTASFHLYPIAHAVIKKNGRRIYAPIMSEQVWESFVANLFNTPEAKARKVEL